MNNPSVFSKMFKDVIQSIEEKIKACDDLEEKTRLKKRLRYLKKKYLAEKLPEMV